jgi:hypothetical protein
MAIAGSVGEGSPVRITDHGVKNLKGIEEGQTSSSHFIRMHSWLWQ